MNTHPDHICVIGTGRLGAPIAACMAAKGLHVIGVDTDPRRVDALNAGQAPLYEPGLQDMIDQAGPRLTATTDTAAAIRTTDVSFILVPTPSDPDGGFSLRYVLPACEQVGAALAGKDTFHLVVLVSTVMPGATGGHVLQTLERASSKRCGQDFGLCYSPEFVALGSVIRDYLHPDFILIGQSDDRSGQILASVHDRVCESPPPKRVMSFVNAELAKIAVNAYITTKITFANTLATICQNLPGAEVDTVTAAIGMDSRIGGKYLKGGLGYGGPCFPRDNRALASLAKSIHANADLPQSVDRINHAQIDRLVGLAKQYLPADGTVGVLGLAYKPQSDVVEQSQGLMLAQRLADHGVNVIAHDPAAADNAKRAAPEGIRFATDAAACIAAADVAVLTTPWQEYCDLDAAAFDRSETPRVLIDPWRVFMDRSFGPGVHYVPGGVGPKVDITIKPRTGLGITAR